MGLKRIKIQFKRRDIPLTLAALILFLFVTVDPLVRYIIPNSTIRNVVLMAALVITLLYTLRSISQTGFDRKEAFLIFYLLLMTALATYRTGWSYVHLVLFGECMLLCAMAYSNDDVTKIARVMLFFSLLMCFVYAVVTFLSDFSSNFYFSRIFPLFPNQRARLLRMYRAGQIAGLTSHYSTNGTFLTIGMLIAAARQSEHRNKWYFLLTLFFAAAILVTGKRAHILFGVSAIFLLFFYSRFSENAVNRWIKTIGIGLIILCVFMVLITFVPSLSKFFVRFQDGLDGGDITNGRMHLWSLALDTFKKHPVFGIGWRKYNRKVSYFIHQSADYDVHNVYLQLLCETGVLGFLVYMVWFVVLFRKTVQVYKQIVCGALPNLSGARFLMSFSLVFQTFFFLYCFTGNPLYEYYTFFPYFLSCALTLYYSGAIRRKQLQQNQKEQIL